MKHFLNFNLKQTVIDLASGTMTGRVTIEDRLAFVGFNPSHNYLVACTVVRIRRKPIHIPSFSIIQMIEWLLHFLKEGFIYAWVFDTLSPLVTFSIKKESGFRQRNPPVVCFATALVDPYACYSRQSSKDIYGNPSPHHLLHISPCLTFLFVPSV